VYVYVCESVWVYVCGCKREREKGRVCVRACEQASKRARGREGEREGGRELGPLGSLH